LCGVEKALRSTVMAARVSRTELLHDALELTPDDRAELASELLASLDGPPDPDAPGAWIGEVRRRVDRVLAGETTGVPWPEVREKLRNRWGQ
jgi:putative addiction module component (TIGR02574 family)